MYGRSRATRARPIPTGRWSRPLNRIERLALGALVLLTLAGCETPKPPPLPDRLTLAPARFQELPGWTADRHADALVALRRSCARIVALPESTALGPDGAGGLAGDWRPACTAASAVPARDHAAARVFLET